ncbi:MAG: polysaccharide deacetylase family protein [Clostridiales bacterium]|nr:polysaccharide deacetylase family protein [Clostridiales bacterium]
MKSRFPNLKIPLIFAAAFLIGALAGRLNSLWRSGSSLDRTSDANSAKAAEILSSQSSSWGLSFQEEGRRPVGNATVEELAVYNAYYARDTDEKIIYLTFDCGYENGNMPAILEALKKRSVSATFFVVGNFISDNPELLLQMTEAGHTIGNHTLTHPDMSQISTLESFQAQLEGVEELYQELTGSPMEKFYRPPQGIYSTENLSMAKELGYHTFFWSLAYVDWYQENQPTREEAMEKLLGRIHPGAIVLLHSTSSTNAEILDDLLTSWEEMGYTFGTLEQLVSV